MIDISSIVVSAITTALADVWHIIGLALVLRVVLFSIAKSRKTVSNATKFYDYDHEYGGEWEDYYNPDGSRRF
ncbi:hypothetical protein [Nitrosomonas aestuarii]|uniref:hypothetical protein n=1 Tax=Nitrosomonas aestuarii TaxID=52441 RepID=UPI000D2F77A1|nr:hypothetical protein [Nitrosomonas aestuarii]PTN12703.1 hypothetical protein C8R11_103272 [Nitrosomonas aestuarii]